MSGGVPLLGRPGIACREGLVSLGGQAVAHPEIAMTTLRPDVSVIVPTYCEAENLPLLVPRIAAACPSAEILIVDDDSPDATAAVCARLPVCLLVRKDQRGLASAVQGGAAGSWGTCAARDRTRASGGDGPCVRGSPTRAIRALERRESPSEERP